jgi:hypothetical protein
MDEDDGDVSQGRSSSVPAGPAMVSLVNERSSMILGIVLLRH